MSTLKPSERAASETLRLALESGELTNRDLVAVAQVHATLAVASMLSDLLAQSRSWKLEGLG